MSLRTTCLLWLSWLLRLPAAWAQQPPLPAADVLLLTTGQEVRGRVLTITPTELTYLPPRPDSLAAPGPPDTLRLPAAQVFLVRYANGTREVLAPAAAPPADLTPPALRGLDAGQRRQLGLRDANRCYRATGAFWGTLGATLYLGPIGGLAPAIGISARSVRDRNLAAPTPQLLQDASYGQGYRQQANRLKRRRTWGGYAIAVLVYGAAFAALASGQ